MHIFSTTNVGFNRLEQLLKQYKLYGDTDITVNMYLLCKTEIGIRLLCLSLSVYVE